MIDINGFLLLGDLTPSFNAHAFLSTARVIAVDPSRDPDAYRRASDQHT